MTFVGPTTLSAEIDRHALLAVAEGRNAVRRQADVIALHQVADARGAEDPDAGARVGRDHVAIGGRGPADVVVAGVLDPHAIPEVPRIVRPEEEAAAGPDADVVPLDLVPGRGGADDMHAVAQVPRDQVAGPRRGPADIIARIGDQDAVGPVRDDEVKARRGS